MTNTGDRQGLAPAEWRAAAGLAGVFATRMLGLFMVLPVLTLEAQRYPDYTPALAGLAIGAYGLTQALLQIPFGLLSDRFGRKPVITAGLILFALGSLAAATSHTLAGVIAGRALQGSGAIAAAVLALGADLTREDHRTRMNAVIGSSIGLSFALALVIGPMISHGFGLSGVFWATAGLAGLGLVLLHGVVPTPVRSTLHRDAEPVPSQLGAVLRDPQLLRLDFGILVLHMVMTSTFVALPLVLRDEGGLAAGRHWQVYLGVLALSVALMVPFILMAERKRRMKPVFVGAVAALALAQAGLPATGGHLWPVLALLVVYFTAFNLLEASLPSLVAKFSPPHSKGTAMGAYSSSQFAGAFLGGALGGWLLGAVGPDAVFLLCAAMAGLWLLAAATMASPRYLTSRLIRVGPMPPDQAALLSAQLAEVKGVAEVFVAAEEGVAYLKVDLRRLDDETLRGYEVGEGESA